MNEEYDEYPDESLEDDFLSEFGDDTCYECEGYGDDWVLNEDGELESACWTCPFYKNQMEGEEDA